MSENNATEKSTGGFPEELLHKVGEIGISLDEIVEKIASLGLPGILLVTMATASTSTTPVIATLTALGGPLGVLGGVGVLGLMTVLGDSVSTYGLEALLTAIYTERVKKENSLELQQEIEGLPITDTLKLNLKKVVNKSEEQEPPRVIEIIED